MELERIRLVVALTILITVGRFSFFLIVQFSNFINVASWLLSAGSGLRNYSEPACLLKTFFSVSMKSKHYDVHDAICK